MIIKALVGQYGLSDQPVYKIKARKYYVYEDLCLDAADVNAGYNENMKEMEFEPFNETFYNIVDKN